MKKKRHTIILILSMLILLSVYTCYAYKPILAHIKNNKNAVSVTVIDSGFPDVTPIDSSLQTSKSILLPVENILQLPELPTGCEITSLTIVLNYLGYNVDKEDMAREYLDMSSSFIGGFNDYFIGSPWEEYSWGCYSSVITRSASRFLTDQNSALSAYNITGSSVEELFLELESGNPVIVWVSRFFDTETKVTPILLDDGTTDYWYSNEHSVVLIGYDLEKNTVTLSDPLEGNVERDLNTFTARYEEFQRMGVVIK